MAGGNAVDSAIATLVCVGATNPQSSGIGGGHFMTVYNSLGSKRIEWRDLIAPTVALCRTGFPVSQPLSEALRREKLKIMEEVSMREFINPSTGHLYKEGEVMYRMKLADTLERIAEADDPVDLFYKGELAAEIVSQMKEHEGLISAADLEDYVTSVYAGDNVLINDHFHPNWTICGPPPPSSFAITQAILSVMFHIYGNNVKKDVLYENADFYHKLIETEKFAYAERLLLGDIVYVEDALQRAKNMTHLEYAQHVISLLKSKAREPEYYGQFSNLHEDHGTSHISVVDANSNAVSCTSSINARFGSLRMSPNLGIIWNSQMDDFSVMTKTSALKHGLSESNLLRAGKKPMSSMSPTIVFNRRSGKTKAVIGGTGGLKIIASVATALLRCLLFNETLHQAIDSPYIFNQYSPFVAQYEKNFPEVTYNQALLSDLEARGHQVVQQNNSTSAVFAILLHDDVDEISAYVDGRYSANTYPTGY